MDKMRCIANPNTAISIAFLDHKILLLVNCDSKQNWLCRLR